MLRTRFLDPSFIGEVSSALWMISQALRHGSPLPHVSIAPLEARLSTAAMGLLVPKMVNPAISSSVSITGDSLRDALLHNITRGGGRRRRGFAEASEDVPTSLVNVHRSRPRFEERDDYFTPGAQTPIHTGSPMQRRSLASSHPTIAVNSQAVGSPPGSIGLTPVATRNDASGRVRQ